ncbi:MAG: exopolysaccharide biosynthesis polyprenyl glycosylphosphotransferase [Pseudorhizobium sp.]
MFQEQIDPNPLHGHQQLANGLCALRGKAGTIVSALFGRVVLHVLLGEIMMLLKPSTQINAVSYHREPFVAGWRGLGHGAISWMVACGDFLCLMAASAAGFVLYEQLIFGSDADPFRYVGIGLVIAMSFVLIMHSAHAYRLDAIVLRRLQIRLICLAIPSTVAFLLAVFFLLKLGASFSRGSMVVTTVMSLTGLICLRLFWHAYLPRALARGAFGRRRIHLICGRDFRLREFEDTALRKGMAIADISWLNDDGTLPGLQAEAAKPIAGSQVDEIVVVWKGADVAMLETHLERLRRSPLPVSVAFEGFIGVVVSGSSRPLPGMTVFQTQRPPLSLYESSLKRLFDLFFALTSLLALSPLLLIIAVAIKLDSHGPVFFKQTRKGYDGHTFRIFKFRSMHVMEDGVHVQQATRRDPRVTRVGAFIRSTSIDELPQFWNVLKGEMSVVGPRPHALAHDDYFDAQIGEYVFRRHVKPGLTGWAQINKCRGETPDLQKMEERVRHDLWYINNWSFWLDVKIICRTVFQLQDLQQAY